MGGRVVWTEGEADAKARITAICEIAERVCALYDRWLSNVGGFSDKSRWKSGLEGGVDGVRA